MERYRKLTINDVVVDPTGQGSTDILGM